MKKSKCRNFPAGTRWNTNVIITTSLLRQNDVVTSFWRNNDVAIASCDRWVYVADERGQDMTRNWCLMGSGHIFRMWGQNFTKSEEGIQELHTKQFFFPIMRMHSFCTFHNINHPWMIWSFDVSNHWWFFILSFPQVWVWSKRCYNGKGIM